MSLHVLRNIFVCFVSLVVLTALGLFPAFARDGGLKILDHLYVIVLENRGFDDALYNGPSPFLLGLSRAQGLATVISG
ncbi:MAG: hypothetical protein ACR2KT_02890 [Methylocella sp.]|nr:MAG: hypothetical protein DLM68_09425 [Hyphomicrobiales bacterium]